MLLDIALIFALSAILATCFIYVKQPVILSYIVVGVLIGPFSPTGTTLIVDSDHIEQVGHFGVILLMFLLGLNLHPQKLYALFKKTSLLTISTCLIFAVTVSCVALAFGSPGIDSVIIGAALMFSSTVVGLKLIPTTALHHRHIGELMISVLLFQDVMAIIMLLMFLKAPDESLARALPILLGKTLLFAAAAFLFVKYVILKLFAAFDKIQEYVFLLSVGWCLGMAQAARQLGLSYEIGAFAAGVSIAMSPISLVISEKLKSLREFFIILFFFAIGAKFDVLKVGELLPPIALITAVVILLKPLALEKAFAISGETPDVSKELAWRLGQASEFSLLIAYVAFQQRVILESSAYIIQLTVILSFIISTYIVVAKFRTPISNNTNLRSD